MIFNKEGNVKLAYAVARKTKKGECDRLGFLGLESIGRKICRRWGNKVFREKEISLKADYFFYFEPEFELRSVNLFLTCSWC